MMESNGIREKRGANIPPLSFTLYELLAIFRLNIRYAIENLILEASFWKVPAWELPLHAVDGIEVFTINGRKIIQEEGWPESFWPHVENRCRLNDSEVQRVLAFFQHLELDEPARCHLPAWGLGLYRKSELLCTITLCFECSNAYIYTGSGKVLRAFDVSEINAVALFRFLKKRLPVIED